MKIAIGADHGGFDLKEHICNYLKQKGMDVDNVGCHSKESVDYPEYGKRVAEKISEGATERGILVCTSGIGMSIVANRYPKVRAGLCLNEDMAKMCRAHNNCNVLVLGSKYVNPAMAEKLVDIWLDSEFEGGRHQRRIDKIEIHNCEC
ncbi:MAG: ribose 5-phosphate isomerase B [Candidatus Auribacterota bacterium]